MKYTEIVVDSNDLRCLKYKVIDLNWFLLVKMTVFRNLFGYFLNQIGLVKNLTLTNLFFIKKTT